MRSESANDHGYHWAQPRRHTPGIGVRLRLPPLGIIESLVSAAFGGISGIQVEFPAPCRKFRPKFLPLSHDSVFPRHSCWR